MPSLRDRGNDIILLFKLFALQMAEKYRLPKITLTEDAKQVLLKYKWPGNVRQLKNITEQMSVLSEQREITAQDLRHFIPEDPESTMLATINSGSSEHSYENEREMLFKVIYDTRNSLADMRREISALRKQLDDANELNSNILARTTPTQQIPAVFGDGNNPAITPPTGIQDAVAEEIKEPETLNLENLGRQMIEKALERNGGNRKKAAQELGISDRTLYRRIKQYGLE
jgi:DNA-binding NtrC family response regulator